ncbi:hypothetical protein O181_007266 [Austropuccinia psidii MF-1]|uniref:Uncharacterized protein n=1 Tax=Austropuccinia psidii MF-1 TaxID=1389203 RepID=A0A9Q3BKH9_9BASI|nr:hypothetical protein [Austropuccinia psidii MF-1]
MKGWEISRRGGMKSRRSISFPGFWGGKHGTFQGPRNRLKEAEYEEGEESMKEEMSEETEVAAALEGSSEAPEVPNLALSTQHLDSQAEPNFPKMMEKMTQFKGQLTQAVSPRKEITEPHRSRLQP